MATVIDEARDADTPVLKAMSAFTQPTPRAVDMDQPFDVLQSAVETHVGFAYETGVDNTADNNSPIVDYVSEPFWLASTPATVR